jgi:hypothetical protein
MSSITSPVSGSTCPLLKNENYEYAFSGDLSEFCKCAVTDNPCFGKVIYDPEDRSNQFFFRAKCGICKDSIRKCPLYGMPIEVMCEVVKVVNKRNEIKLP